MSQINTATIDDYRRASHSNKTLSTYKTYIKQFNQFLVQKSSSLETLSFPEKVLEVESFLYSKAVVGTSNAVDQARSSLVYYFNEKSEYDDQNPAKHSSIRKFVLGTRKRKRKFEHEEPEKAYPVGLSEMRELINQLENKHHYIRIYYTFLLILSFIGCFRISEVLALKWKDISLKLNEKGIEYIAVKLVWHKTATIAKDSSVFNLYQIDEPFAIIEIFKLFKNNLQDLSINNINGQSFIFCNYMFDKHGSLNLSIFESISQQRVREYIADLTNMSSALPETINLHSFRRGGSSYRVFEAINHFSINEICAWCRWENPKTLSEYLLTKQLVKGIILTDLLNPIRKGKSRNSDQNSILDKDIELISEKVVQKLSKCVSFQNLSTTKIIQKIPEVSLTQSKLEGTLVISSLPKITSAKYLWDLWFYGDSKVGIMRPLKDFSNDAFQSRKAKQNFSEKRIICLEMEKYESYDSFYTNYKINVDAGFRSLRDIIRNKRKALN